MVIPGLGLKIVPIAIFSWGHLRHHLKAMGHILTILTSQMKAKLNRSWDIFVVSYQWQLADRPNLQERDNYSLLKLPRSIEVPSLSDGSQQQ